LIAAQFRQETFEEIHKLNFLFESRFQKGFESLYAMRNLPNTIGLILSALLALLLASFAWHFTRRIRSSLTNLETAAKKVSGGEHGYQAPILHGDEIGSVTKAFNAMTRELAQTVVGKELLEEKNRELEQFSYDLNALMKSICEDLEVLIQTSEARIDCTNLPTIHADHVQMKQLFQNLIGNAIKFRKKDVPPHVRIESKQVNEKLVEIRIMDNGIGFDNKFVERIFMPFKRLHTRDEFKGNGIGLAICKKIVQRHGGTIHAQSVEGIGTTFLLQLAA
jgi:light-regulated signal transduction histidine kinase (bacteriophytochrome)